MGPTVKTLRTGSTQTAIARWYLLFLAMCYSHGDGFFRRAVADERSSRERIIFHDDARTRRDVSGRVVVEAQDGGLLVLGDDGRLWTVEKPQLEAREKTGEEFKPLPAEALGKRLQDELGAGFEVVTTKHYVICSSAGRQYAQWCGSLFERLYSAFQNYWKQRGIELHEPEFPLVALVFRNEAQFAAFATRDAGPDAAGAKGYYSIGTNRMVLYDLTTNGGGAATAAEINRRLAAAPFNVATVVHEATHQIAFNSGMHTRYADNPLWVSEGMAMYFETPDLTSRTGWKTVGAVNDLRLRQFLDYAAKRRPPDSLATLVQSDARFTDADQAGDAYAEAWALSYFLIKTRKDDYAEYLKQLAAKPQLVWNKPEERLAEFKAAFGEDLLRLDAEFVKYVRRLGK
jgi:hypothetical protein